jgi:hypothetical protein
MTFDTVSFSSLGSRLSAFPVRARSSTRHMLLNAGVHRAVRRAFHKAARR